MMNTRAVCPSPDRFFMNISIAAHKYLMNIYGAPWRREALELPPRPRNEHVLLSLIFPNQTTSQLAVSLTIRTSDSPPEIFSSDLKKKGSSIKLEVIGTSTWAAEVFIDWPPTSVHPVRVIPRSWLIMYQSVVTYSDLLIYCWASLRWETLERSQKVFSGRIWHPGFYETGQHHMRLANI